MQARPLLGQVALVTGAGTGIGHATVLALAELGATVALHYFRNESGALSGVTQIRSMGGTTEMFAADLTDPQSATGLVDRVVSRFDRLDMLVNNTGNPLQRMALENCPLELWRAAFDVNVTSAFLVTQRAIPHLRKTRGRIVNNLSLSVQTGGAGGAGPYAAAKGALHVFTRTLARELAPDIRVNAVMPGVIETRHHEIFSTPERMADYRRQTPLGRNGEAHEAAAAIAFLCGPGSSFMTGSLLDISGGRFLR